MPRKHADLAVGCEISVQYKHLHPKSEGKKNLSENGNFEGQTRVNVKVKRIGLGKVRGKAIECCYFKISGTEYHVAATVPRLEKKAAGSAKPKDLGKKIKDPNKPKRGMSAFFFFSNSIRETVKSEMPHLKFTEISKEIGLRWGKVDPANRKQYEIQAAEDKARYQREMQDYVAPPQQYSKKKKKKKDPNAPKRASSAYLFFCNNKRPDLMQVNPGVKITEIAKMLAGQWREATPAAKKPFEKMAENDKVRYAAEKAAYDAQQGNFF